MCFSLESLSAFLKVALAMGLKLTPFPGAKKDYFFFRVFSSETVSFFLPFLLRDANTLRPLAVAILSRNPCLFFLFLRDGWYVRFIIVG